MTGHGFTLFETAIGTCGVAWSERGIVAVELPGRGSAQTAARLKRRVPGAAEGAAPGAVRDAIEAMAALLAGERPDLTGVVLDLQGVAPFDQSVYAIARAIPAGETLTYGEVAARLGDAAARAVGRALGANPFPIVVPCHRVLGAEGKAGGFSAPGGVAAKARMLSIEGARTSPAPMLFEALPITVRTDRPPRA
jgi:methylated-DNA-[protein]-cysteine S-methyltransferase